jgi:tRNA-dihydrouridine synthase
VIGNGDVTTPEDVVRMREHTGCAGVMIARGSFGNPWIFGAARELLSGRARPAAPTAEQRIETALEHARLTLELEGEGPRAALEFRKHLGWYTRGLPGSAELRARLQQVTSLKGVEQLFAEYQGRHEPVLAAAG